MAFLAAQVQDKWPERWPDEAIAERASGEWSNAGREEADVIIVGEVRPPGDALHRVRVRACE